MAEHPDSSWPSIDEAYADVYGRIEPEVYEAAKALWPKAEALALGVLRDVAIGRELMMKAVANVSHVHTTRPAQIKEMKAYVFQSYKYLVLAELKKIRLHTNLEHEAYAMEPEPFDATGDKLDQKILIEQLMRSTDDWTRDIFQQLLLGYSFEEIGRKRGVNGRSIGNKFNKRIKILIKRITTENSLGD